MNYEILCNWPLLSISLFLEHSGYVPLLSRGVQSAAHRSHVAQDGYDYGPTQNSKFA